MQQKTSPFYLKNNWFTFVGTVSNIDSIAEGKSGVVYLSIYLEHTERYNGKTHSSVFKVTVFNDMAISHSQLLNPQDIVRVSGKLRGDLKQSQNGNDFFVVDFRAQDIEIISKAEDRAKDIEMITNSQSNGE